MRVLILDNGDPRIENLVKPIEDLGGVCQVCPSGSLDLPGIEKIAPRRIVLTSGPGRPEDTGVCPEVVLHLAGHIPVLAVGLGMHVLAHVGRGRLMPAPTPRGPVATLRNDGKNLFAGLPDPFTAPRDPDLQFVIDGRKLNNDLEASAWDEDGTILGCRIWALSMEGIQVDTSWFSTQLGSDMLFNFLFQSQVW